MPAMPFYEYIASTESGCETCRAGFTRLQKLDDPDIKRCPDCDAPVKRLISAPHVVSGQAHRLQESNIEKHGFTQYRRAGGGVYEKTAGKGPDFISDGDD